MKTVQIQMTERHLAFAYDLVKDMPVDRYLSTAVSIKNAVKANTDPNALLTVEIETDIIGQVYRKQSALSEGYAATINAEMEAALIPQLMQYAAQEADEQAVAIAAAGPDEEPAVVDMSVTSILNQLIELNQSNAVQLESTISASLQKLKA